jgi:hypothetical protein
MEPNVVFVYKNDSQNYITASDLIGSEKWKTFELNHGDEFDTFDHKKSKPLEGRGFVIKQDDMNSMAEEINQHIQKYRHLRTSPATEGMDGRAIPVHIVSSESAAGSLRFGLERPKIVIGFPDFFSIGPLWKLHEKIGQSYRNEWLEENINFEQDDEYQIKFNNTLRELEDISAQAPIHIWFADNAHEQTGIRFLIYLLKDKANEIFLINSTELYGRYLISKDEEQHIFGTSQIESKNLRLLFEKRNPNKPLSDEERIQFQREWEALSQTKDVLRLWINDETIGVQESHFDPLIIKTIENLHNKLGNKDFIKAGRVIEELFIQMDEFVDVFYLEYRIRHLIYSGVLELKGIPKSMRHYSVKIR